MNPRRIHRITGTLITILSFTALVSVLTGYFHAPQPDEGSAAHIFQLSVALLFPLGVAFLITVDRTRPWQGMRHLALPATLVIVAFAALYYLEHYYYLAH